MVFSSAIFLFLFLPLALLVYGLVPRTWKNAVLLIASLLFYTWGEPLFVFILLASITADYYIARAIPKHEKPAQKKLLVLSLFINLALLAYFKYANFFFDNISQIHQWMGGNALSHTSILLPIGISFVTFQKISYVIDVYRRDTPPQSRWDNLALYILMFPQLIAGPIIRYKEVSAQIEDRRANENAQNRINGLWRFFIGLSKKVLIANILAEQVDIIFATDPGVLSTGSAWIGMFAYSLQIYFDFSGYSDMAIGLGQAFGFRFPENFNFPYLAQSFTEFWKRWHITLGSWMMDYLYIPLGGNRKGKRRTLINLAIVFLLSGLWHGAAWTFVVWGLYHGCFLILDKLGLRKILQKAGKIPAILFTLLFVMIGWVIFRADTIEYAGHFISRLVSFQCDPDQIIYNARFITTIVFAFILSFIGFQPSQEHKFNHLFSREYSSKRNLLIAGFIVLLLIVNGCALLAGGFNPFIYFRF